MTFHRHLRSACAVAALLVPHASAQWTSNAALNTVIADRAGDQAVPKIAASGDGATWLGWFDNGGSGYEVRVQRLDAQGNATFAHGGLLVSANPQQSFLVDWDLIDDGAGGCVLAFVDVRAGGDLDPYAYRIDAAGNFLWGANGVALSTDAEFEANPALARASDGHFVCAWTRSPSSGPGSIRIQRLDANGAASYAQDGIAINGPASEKPGFARVAAALGGDYVVSFVRDTATFASPRHVRAQKFDAAGNALWNGGAPVAIFDASSVPIAHTPELLSDGSGGAILGWYRASGASDFGCFVQRVDASGLELFPHNGVSVANDASFTELNPSLAYLEASDELVVAFVKKNAAQSQAGLAVQKISAAGARLWTDSGVELRPLDSAFESFARALPFGDGAVVLAFHEPTFGSTSKYVYGFRVDGNGAHVWATVPVVACSTLAGKDDLVACIDRTGVARLAWDDERAESVGDLYAQNVDCDGTLGNGSPAGWASYCVAAPNSVGAGALIGANGSTALALNDLDVTCTGLPPSTNTLLFTGPSAIQVPFGNGFRCVGGTIRRLGIVQATASGTLSRQLDFESAPLASIVSAGSTWNFQVWYRNVAGGGAGFNLSDGLTVTFCP